VNLAGTGRKVLEVLLAGLFKMSAQAFLQGQGERNNAVLAALAIVNGDGAFARAARCAERPRASKKAAVVSAERWPWALIQASAQRT